MTAAATHAAPPRAGAGIARPLLPIHLFRRSGNHAATLRLRGSQPLIRLIHHHHVMQQLLVDAGGDVRGIDVVLADFFSQAVVNRQAGHDCEREFKVKALRRRTARRRRDRRRGCQYQDFCYQDFCYQDFCYQDFCYQDFCYQDFCYQDFCYQDFCYQDVCYQEVCYRIFDQDVCYQEVCLQDVRFADDQIAAIGAGNGAADQEQIMLEIDADHFQIARGLCARFPCGRPCASP